MPKYRRLFRKMLENHKQEFAQFSAIHQKYTLDQTRWQDEYNRLGAPSLDIIQDWENRLCGHSEKGQFNKYSANLAEKFRGEIKAFFPMIDFIGIQVVKPATRPAPVSPEPTPVTGSDPDLTYIDALDPDLASFTLKKLL